jgi:hypothetical protein
MGRNHGKLDQITIDQMGAFCRPKWATVSGPWLPRFAQSQQFAPDEDEDLTACIVDPEDSRGAVEAHSFKMAKKGVHCLGPRASRTVDPSFGSSDWAGAQTPREPPLVARWASGAQLAQ